MAFPAVDSAPERGFAEFRLLDFLHGAAGRPGPPRMRRTLFRNDAVYFSVRDDPRPLTELYRRFQNPRMVWRHPDGRSGVLLLARDWLDVRFAPGFGIPAGVRYPESQDRGVRVIAYGPPAAPSAAPVPAERLVTRAMPRRPSGCGDLAAWDPDWLGRRRVQFLRRTVIMLAILEAARIVAAPA